MGRPSLKYSLGICKLWTIMEKVAIYLTIVLRTNPQFMSSNIFTVLTVNIQILNSEDIMGQDGPGEQTGIGSYQKWPLEGLTLPFQGWFSPNSSLSATLLVKDFIYILTSHAWKMTYLFMHLQFPLTKSPHWTTACFDAQHVIQCHSNDTQVIYNRSWDSLCF